MDTPNNEVREIPGFENLKKFSSHPDLQSYIADKIAESWADKAMTWQGLGTALGSKPMERDESEELFAKLKEKIDSHQQPQIVFTGAGNKFQTHVLLVSDYQVENGRTTFCLRDNNIGPKSNASCSNKMSIASDGSIIYSSWGRLGSVALAHNDNSDALEQLESLKNYCAKEESCP